MLILFIILTMVFSSYVIKTSTAEFEEQIDVQLRGITTQIDNTLRLADDIALQIAANYQIIDAFSGLQEYHDEKNYFVENTDVDYTIKQHLISYMLKQNILKRISLFNSNQDITYVGKAVDFGYLKKDCPNPDIFTDTQSYFADQKGKGSLFRVDSSDPYMREISPTISVLREIKNYQLIPSECLGYAQVQIQIDSFARLGKLLGKETECFVLDQKNDHVLYSFQSNRKESEIKTLLRQTNNLQGGLYCKLWDSEKYGIKVLIVSKNTGLIHSLMSTFTWGIFLLFSLITIMILAQKIIIQRTTEPIVQMCEMLTGLQVDKNLQEIPLVICDETDELRQLNNAFNELIKNLKLSMEKEMASKVNEIQCQMYALQTQMNPHFIHNILTIISAMSSTSEYEKIPEICEKLSSMIRYNISSSEDFGNLDGEILHAENYLELMKIRYEDKFQYSMSYVGEIQNCHLPKFIIQPLLENCFAHGFRNKEFPWQINIQIYCTEECWEVQIQDNGCGICEEDLKEILNKERKSIGVRNTNKRIHMIYGEKYGVTISSQLEEGTVVTIRLPLKINSKKQS